MNSKIGEIIERYRKEKGYTQGELAKKLGVSNTAISKWEHGYNLPDIGLLEPLSKILGIDMMLLLTTENIEKEEKDKSKKIKSLVNILSLILLFLAVITSSCLLVSSYYNKKIDKLKEEQTKAYRFYNDEGELIVNGYILLNKEESIVVIDYIKQQLQTARSEEEQYTSAELYLYVDEKMILNQRLDNISNKKFQLIEILNQLDVANKLENKIDEIKSSEGKIKIHLMDERGKIIKKIIEVKLQPSIQMPSIK